MTVNGAATEATGFEPTLTALVLVDDARAAILDCHTGPLTEYVYELPTAEARQLVQALAMVAATISLMDEASWARTRKAFYRSTIPGQGE